MTEAEEEGEGRGGGRGDDTGSRRGKEVGVTSRLSNWRMENAYFLFEGTNRAPRV